MQHLDPHERPPDGIRNVYKKYQKMTPKELDWDADIVDLTDYSVALPSKVRLIEHVGAKDLKAAFRIFAGSDAEGELRNLDAVRAVPIYEYEDLPGLLILPTLLPREIQYILLSRLLHRDLSNPEHLTNIHTHYTLSYPPSPVPPNTSSTNTSQDTSPNSFFSLPPTSSSPIATPIDPSIHKPLSTAHFLTKKLRWATLGGQYNWTEKRYPSSLPPQFPPDIARLLRTIFPSTTPEAAILNIYSPGDTLSPHRDVAETSSRGLISVSLGCDAIFVVGKTEGEVVVLRLRSGSAVVMQGEARWSWHGVAKIVGGTCPEELADWPAGKRGNGGMYEEWRGWMAGKRVNLNVRQMGD